MKFRYFTHATRKGVKIAVNVDMVQRIEAADVKAGTTYIFFGRNNGEKYEEFVEQLIEVGEDFDTVFSRLNTIAERGGRHVHFEKTISRLRKGVRRQDEYSRVAERIRRRVCGRSFVQG